MKIVEKEGRLIVTDFDEMEAYEIACVIEKEGIRFYSKLRAQEQDASVQEMLGFMINDEKGHLKFFESILDELRSKKDDDVEDNDLIMSMDFGIFQPFQDIEHLEEVITDSKKALKLGMITEKRAIDFYLECRNKVSSESTKKELDRIIAEENKHKSLFEKMTQDLS